MTHGLGGAVSTGTFKGGIQGAFSALLFFEVGQSFGDYTTKTGEIIASKFATAVALHGVVGCVTSLAGGGKCGPGALSAAFSKLATPLTGGLNPAVGVVASAVIGGTASALGGGKFANGAQTAAFSYLFNCSMSRDCRQHGRAKIDSTASAVRQYYDDPSGADVTLGSNTEAALKNNPRVQRAIDNLTSGSTTPDGSFGVNLTASATSFHVGNTAIDYSTACGRANCTTTFVGFVRDGFWDVTSDSGGDRAGPANELRGGTPYAYKPYSWQITYPLPERWKTN